jgi:outer membrane protein
MRMRFPILSAPRLSAPILAALSLCLACGWSATALGADAPAAGVSRIVVQGNTLEDFFTAALDYSPQLRIAQERWNIGSARRRAANGQLLPQLNANASVSDNRQDALGRQSDYRGERYSLQLTQVLFNWQAFQARGQAYLLEDLAEAEYFAEVANLLTEVSEKYFDVLQAEDGVTSIAAEVDATTNQLNQIQSLYELQAAQITDLYDAQARLAAVQAEQLDMESQLALNREELRALTGVYVDSLYRLDDAVTIPPVEGSVESWLSLARTGNLQIRAREFAVEAADKRVAERQGTYMPRVTLIAQQQLSDIGFDNMPMDRTDTNYIGIDVSVPLFAGGSNRASVSEARSLYHIAENELRQVQLDVVERTRLAYLQVKSSELRTVAAQRLADSTALSYTARQRGFELGTVTSVDVLNALRDRFRAERDLQVARYAHIRANLRLKREAGTLSAEDLLDVGSWLIAPAN